MTRQETLAVALNHAVLAHGFAKSSMNTLAQQVHISRATLYLYFKNKEAVIAAVCARHHTFLQRNQPKTLPLSAAGYLTLRLNTMLLLGARSPVFRADLAAQYPARAAALDADYARYTAEAVTQLQTLQQAKILAPTVHCETLIPQDELLITGALRQVIAAELAVEDAVTLLRDYFESAVRGTVVDGLALPFAAVAPLTERVLAELRDTYAYR
ncbi:TetR/AcrR family transcriptional regulator [Lacticaseibacillus absianus]|uniref:TetR/AcrR family transcriptional regulator n=1 Tax=Lacticaseibacillus absianus TaxID=2729623 RepID=UPI0015CAC9E3|nr:TetR/AcrR family transcriptional regulator [Lacticaseibacillus absianus]